MTKLFALISVLLFIFKALAANAGEPATTETNARSGEETIKDAIDEYTAHCANKKAKNSPPSGSAWTDEKCRVYYDKYVSPNEVGACEKANDKFDTRYREFLKTKKEDTRAARKESSEAEKAAQEAHSSCQEKTQDIQEEINAANESLQTQLQTLEEEISSETNTLNENLKISVEKAKDLTDQIAQVVGSELISLETNYSASMRKLLVECQKSINQSLVEARKYMDERRKARNAGLLKYSSTTGSFNKSKDQVEAQKMIDQTKEICKAEETNLKQTKELQLKVLEEKLQSLKNSEALLQVELNKINQELQGLPNKKLEKQNKLTQESLQKIQNATIRLTQQKATCAQDLSTAQKQAQDIVTLANSEQEDPESVLSLFDAAQSACCTSTAATSGTTPHSSYPLLCGKDEKGKTKARKKIKSSLGGSSGRGSK